MKIKSILFKQIPQSVLLVIMGALLGALFLNIAWAAWTEPSSPPPDGNVDKPLNVSGDPQGKAGDLGVGTTNPDARLDVEGGNLDMSNNGILNSWVDFSAQPSSRPSHDGDMYRWGGQAYISFDDHLYFYSEPGWHNEREAAIHYNDKAWFRNGLELDGDFDMNGNNISSVDLLQFQNHEWGDFTNHTGLYWDLSAGLYIRSYNAPYSDSRGRLIWSGENVHEGSGINISYNGEDEPTISVSGSVGGENLAQTLAIGNSAGSYNINMNDREIDNINYLDMRAGEGYGLRFWSSNNYKISMGNSSNYRYGWVNDYSIKMQMNNDNNRGFTWGKINQTPTASLDTQGYLTLAGDLRVNGRDIYFENQNLYGDNSSALYWDSNHNSVTQMIFRDRQNTIYGRVYGSGNGSYFGLLDKDGNWSYLAVKDNYTDFRINNYAMMTLRYTTNPKEIDFHSNKLSNVREIDPVFNIEGKKYVSYMPDSIGQKVYAVGEDKLDGDKLEIDLAAQPEGSDLWLFWQVVAHDSVVPFVSAQSPASLYAYMDGSKVIVKLKDGQKDASFSLRLIGTRIDHADDTDNLYDDQSVESYIDIDQLRK